MMKESILAVDDDPTILRLFEIALEREGYRVYPASSAEEALEILKERDFHVMLFDLKLPGMNGIDLCRKVKGERPDAVIFAITAYPSIFEISGCLSAGFDDYFSKPVDLDMLVRSIRKAFPEVQDKKK